MTIIAEIGVAWIGDIELLSNMMSKAKNSGVDMVKLQAFLPEHVAGHPAEKELIKASVTEKNVKQITDLAEANRVRFMCTPFYPEAVDFLNPFVDRWKIRERDTRAIIGADGSSSPTNPTPLWERVLKTGKLIYASCQTRPIDPYWMHQPFIRYLWCKPDYPTRIEDMELWKCGVGYGLSNHCPDILAPITAAALMLNARDHNARIIEVHVSEEPKSAYVDGIVSFNFDELGTIVQSIRKLERMKLERLV